MAGVEVFMIPGSNSTKKSRVALSYSNIIIWFIPGISQNE